MNYILLAVRQWVSKIVDHDCFAVWSSDFYNYPQFCIIFNWLEFLFFIFTSWLIFATFGTAFLIKFVELTQWFSASSRVPVGTRNIEKKKYAKFDLGRLAKVKLRNEKTNYSREFFYHTLMPVHLEDSQINHKLYFTFISFFNTSASDLLVRMYVRWNGDKFPHRHGLQLKS